MLPCDEPIPPASDPLPSFDNKSRGSKDQLQGVLQVCGKWLENLPAHDPRRENLDVMAVLIKDIIESGDYSLRDAMTTARALLCTNCRRLNAAPDQCAGRSLDRCPLVRAESMK
jgi:hypothetical protein